MSYKNEEEILMSELKNFYTIDDAISMDYETTKELQLKHLNRERTLAGNSKYFVKAEDCWFTDYEGNRHLCSCLG